MNGILIRIWIISILGYAIAHACPGRDSWLNSCDPFILTCFALCFEDGSSTQYIISKHNLDMPWSESRLFKLCWAWLEGVRLHLRSLTTSAEDGHTVSRDTRSLDTLSLRYKRQNFARGKRLNPVRSWSVSLSFVANQSVSDNLKSAWRISR